jgi:ATP-dependent Clp protease protease subunit
VKYGDRPLNCMGNSVDHCHKTGKDAKESLVALQKRNYIFNTRSIREIMIQNQPMMQDNSFNNDGPIWVTSFDSDATKVVCDAILRAADDPSKPIVLYINTPGGEAGGLAAMLATIDAVPNKVITVAMGYAMSAGCFLLSHGDIRLASPYSRIMLHKVQSGAWGNVDDIANESSAIAELNKMMFEVFAQNVGKSIKEVEESIATKRELYMSAQEAKAYGIVDAIGVPRVEMVMSPTYNIAIVAPESEAKAQIAAAKALKAEAAPKKTKKTKK